MRSGLWPGFIAFFVYLLTWTLAFKHLDIFNDLDLGVHAWPLAWLYCLLSILTWTSAFKHSRHFISRLGPRRSSVPAFGLALLPFVYLMTWTSAFMHSRRFN